MWIKIGRLLSYLNARLFARISTRKRLQAPLGQKILVLCYGNIYRSPFIGQLLHDRLHGIPAWEVRSAGFHHVENRQVEPLYIQQCKRYGIALEGHRSKRVSRDDLAWADMIVIMDGHNYRQVWTLDSKARDKLIWLGACSADTPVEIQDPYGQAPEQQRRILAELYQAGEALLSKLLAKA